MCRHELLDVQYQPIRALALRREKTDDLDFTVGLDTCQGDGEFAQGNGFQAERHCAWQAGFKHLGFVFELHAQYRQAGRRVAQRLGLCQAGQQFDAIHGSCQRPDQEFVVSADALRASSRSTDFIMTEGSVCACLVLMKR